ncbi:restriction endonuclease subunit S, partial [Fusobacterium mortiferum]|nr:restriction endonuclease subunit S [Fusobacterium mortiferum]
MFDFINNYLESEKKILPIIISGNSSTLSQSFLLGLQQTLKGEELEDFMPDTSYISAIKVIKNWEEKYPETYEILKSRLNISIQEFILKLQEYDVQSYRFFEKIYPELTSGSSFNPFANGDIVELYE